ncbi:MAG: PTS sugar transporter subunit IIB [Tissierellia bacterium]|nr:PTS sugar transporter subunit IIB [Tissierellia bacterium]
MVGIVIASHGDFAKGIKESGELIFGEQKDVCAVTLHPHEGPEDFKNKLLEAIKSFESDEEVLFLVDLWGGTPFNQVSSILKGHEDKWAVVTGLNLPMLIEAYGSRLASEKAIDVAKEILSSARDGVKTLPESIDDKKDAEITTDGNQNSEDKKVEEKMVKGQIPEGTVLGDGKIKYVLSRIDTRLLHGQVATSWTKSTHPNRIIVVSDRVSQDELRKGMITQAAPPGVKANVIPIKKLIEVDKDPRFGATKAMLLFETPQDALKAIEGGVDIKELNLGSMAHSKGKAVINKAIAMDKEDVETIEKILDHNVDIVVKKVPSDSNENINNMLKKAKSLLNN